MMKVIPDADKRETLLEEFTDTSGTKQEQTENHVVLPRMSAAPQSSMPADLDKVITPPEMADLLAYIRGQ